MFFGFVGGDASRDWFRRTPEARRAQVLENFAMVIGERALEPLDYFEVDWPAEEWSRGAPVAYAPTGVLLDYGSTIREPVGPIHWGRHRDRDLLERVHGGGGAIRRACRPGSAAGIALRCRRHDDPGSVPGHTQSFRLGRPGNHALGDVFLQILTDEVIFPGELGDSGEFAFGTA